MKIKIEIEDNVLTGILYSNSTAMHLAKQLPVTVTLEDYAKTEKVFYISEKLSVTNAPIGYKPNKGDITYYTPWGNVAIFYKNFGFANGLVSIGRIDEESIPLLQFSGNKKAVITIQH